MKLGILGAGMIVREFLPWLTGPESPFKVEALCSTERSAGAAQALCDQYGVPRHTTMPSQWPSDVPPARAFWCRMPLHWRRHAAPAR